MDEKLKDIELQTRSYLYGRVLAALEYLEKESLKKSEELRETNATRFWNSYTVTPRKTLNLLIGKGQPYWKRLKRHENGMARFIKGDKVIQECATRIEKLEEKDNSSGSQLDEDFIFGYYAQKQKLYEPKEKQTKSVENEKVNAVVEK